MHRRRSVGDYPGQSSSFIHSRLGTNREFNRDYNHTNRGHNRACNRGNQALIYKY